MHLIVAKYADEAERKRIEYTFERWKDAMGITKPVGTTVIVEGEGVEEMLDDLYSRTSKDNVRVYDLSKAFVEVEKGEKRIEIDLEGDLKTIERVIGFIMAKQKAIFRREIPSGKLYEVYTKKGQAEIATILKKGDGKVSVRINIAGYGEAPNFLYAKINSELKYLKEV